MTRSWRQTLRAPAVSRTVRASAGRVSWGLGDQAVFSLTNFAVGIYVARTLGLTDFGIFSLAWVTYSVVVSLSRGLSTDPLSVALRSVRWDSPAGRTPRGRAQSQRPAVDRG